MNALRWFWLAAALGSLHAAASLYWALGGVWLLDTVSPAAVAAVRQSPLGESLTLLAVAAFKAAAALAPWANAQGGLPWPAFWRRVAWLGGGFLLLYGAANALGAAGVLLGWWPGGDSPRPALLGHALLWDPLFALWGAALLCALWLSRP